MSRQVSRIVAGGALLAAGLLSACVHQTLPATGGGNGAAPGIAPQLAVERFLRAANCVAKPSCATKAQDIETMGRLFGTKDGPIAERDAQGDVEQRMFALASLVASDDYRVEGQNIVPGRLGEAVQMIVALRQGDRQLSVPMIMVRARGGNWLVELIDTKARTARP